MANQNSFESDYEIDDDDAYEIDDDDAYEIDDDDESVDGDYDVVAIDPSDAPILSSEDLVEIESDSIKSYTFDTSEVFELGVIDTDFAGYVAEDLTTKRYFDSYDFTVDQSNNFTFVLDGLSADADLYLFNEDIEIIGDSSNSDSDAEALTANLGEGTYSVSIFTGIEGDFPTDYELTITSGDFAIA